MISINNSKGKSCKNGILWDKNPSQGNSKVRKRAEKYCNTSNYRENKNVAVEICIILARGKKK